MARELPVTEHVAKSGRHTTFYLACGPASAPLIIFVHGWPELSISWRHQLPSFAGLGFRAIAPDMRGYGRSSLHQRHEDYRLEAIVADMLELLQSLGADKAVWVGHDWGSPVVWSLASHHPNRCYAVANLCVPYIAAGFCLENLLPQPRPTLRGNGSTSASMRRVSKRRAPRSKPTYPRPSGSSFARATPRAKASRPPPRKSAATAVGSVVLGRPPAFPGTMMWSQSKISLSTSPRWSGTG